MTTTPAARGPIGRARASLAAVETVFRLREEQATPTHEDLEILRGWAGWGPMAPALELEPKEGTWSEISRQLRETLPPNLIRAGEQATPTAFYTPDVITTAAWQVLRDLGFGGGTILEPGCGAGTFMAHTPADVTAAWVGVERDPTTARIAGYLHPESQIINAPIQKATIPRVEAVLGNVPYADTPIHDPAAPKAAKENLHNYCIWRSVRSLKPGGIAVLLTSRYTMDSDGDDARRLIARDAELLGAVRLPNSALNEGGTDALADILILRRRDGDPPTQDDPWVGTSPAVSVPGQRINDYFVAHPEHVLGSIEPDHAPQYGRVLKVVPPEGQDLAAELRRAFAGIAGQAVAEDKSWNVVPDAETYTIDNQPFPVREDGRKEGSFHLDDQGQPCEIVDGQMARVERAGKELPKLIRLRDATLALLDAEADYDRPDASMAPLRAEVNRLYDAYFKAHGPINRYTVHEGKVDEETGLATVNRRYPRLGGFRRDPDFVAVLALENFDDETQTATKATLLTERVNRRYAPPTSADTPEEALGISLNLHNRIDKPTIASLLGIPEDGVAEALGDLVYHDPDDGQLITGGDYLSGHVLFKLERARVAAAENPAFERNVTALEEVQPEPLTPEDIRAKLGAPWIPPEDIEQFIEELLERPAPVQYMRKAAAWTVDPPMRRTAAATEDWGTADFHGYELISLALNSRAPVVHDIVIQPDGSEKRVRNEKATMLAESKQQAIQQRFAAWAWEDPDRAERLAEDYNRRFNSYVPRRNDGRHLTFEGWSAPFEPYSHQKDMVARVVAAKEGSLCPYPVGTGKTATMFMTALTMKRFGLANKPMVVVPNHLLEEISREGKKLFPGANILMAGKKDLESQRARMLFAARVATGDWSAVVMTQSAFTRLGVHPTTEAKYLEKLADDYRAALGEIEDDSDRRIKQIAKMVDRFDARASDLRAKATDAGVSYENLGIDFFLVDEAHYFKNLALPAASEGMSLGKPSKRATDLDLKITTTRERTGRDNVVCLFTGTPISNAMREMYVFKHYLMPKRLEELGLEAADAWGANYIRFESRPEVGVDGVSFRLRRRAVEYENADEAISMFNEIAELRPPESFDVERPRREDRNILVPPNDELVSYVESIGRRIDKIQAGMDPRVDNMLKVITDGRKAALDLELLGLDTPAPGKAEAVVDNVLEIWRDTKDMTWPDSDAVGGFQIVFCDLGTPGSTPAERSKKGTQVYGKIREGLVAGGIPRERVRFIHDYNSDLAKTQLFSQCRNGEVSVLLASTEKAGVGTNVQTLAVALHHVDPPHKPAEIEQRDGRIWRPGNKMIKLDKPVQILRYLSEKSFDSYMYQALERKQRPINMVMSGRKVGRVMEEVDDLGISFSEAKAAITGNTLLLDLAQANADLTKLRNLADGHKQAQSRLRRKVQVLGERIAETENRVSLLERATATVAGSPEGQWRRDGVPISEDEVGGELAQAALGSFNRPQNWQFDYRGLPVAFTRIRLDGDALVFHAHVRVGEDTEDIRLGLNWFGKGQTWRIGKAVADFADTAAAETIKMRKVASGLTAERADQASRLGRPFAQHEALEEARARKDALEEAISGEAVSAILQPAPDTPREMTEAEIAMHDAQFLVGELGGSAVVLQDGEVFGTASLLPDQPTDPGPPAGPDEDLQEQVRYQPFPGELAPEALPPLPVINPDRQDWPDLAGAAPFTDPDDLTQQAETLFSAYGIWERSVITRAYLAQDEQARGGNADLAPTNQIAALQRDYLAALRSPKDPEEMQQRYAICVARSRILARTLFAATGQFEDDTSREHLGRTLNLTAALGDGARDLAARVLATREANQSTAGESPAPQADSPQSESVSTRTPREVTDGLGDRVMIGHIGPAESVASRPAPLVGWLVTELLSDQQIQSLAQAHSADGNPPPPNLSPFWQPTQYLPAWIAEQRKEPEAAFYSSDNQDLPRSLRGRGEVKLSKDSEGLKLVQAGGEIRVLWEELPAWLDTAMAYDAQRTDVPDRGTGRFRDLGTEMKFANPNSGVWYEAKQRFVEALSEAKPPTEEQLAVSREKYAQPDREAAAQLIAGGGWLLPALFDTEQMKQLIQAVVADPIDGPDEPTRFLEWVSNRKEEAASASFPSHHPGLPAALRGYGTARVNAAEEGLNFTQGERVAVLRWEEIPAWVAAAVLHHSRTTPPTGLRNWKPLDQHIAETNVEYSLGVAMTELNRSLLQGDPPVETSRAASRERYAAAGLPLTTPETETRTESTPGAATEAAQGPAALPTEAVPGAAGYSYTEEHQRLLTLYASDGSQVGTAKWSHLKYRYEGNVFGNSVRGTDDGETTVRRMANHHQAVYGDRVHRPEGDTAGRDPVWIEHNATGTLVHGVDRDDATVRAAMWSAGGFKESRRIGAWYLPRSWKEITRRGRVETAVAVLAAAGRTVEVHADPAVRATPPPAQPAPLAVTLPGREDLPPLEPDAPYTADPQVDEDLDALDAAWNAWAATKTARVYHDQDQRHRPNGYGQPANPIARLHSGYLMVADRRPLEQDGPEEVVDRFRLLAAWAEAISTVIPEEDRPPLERFGDTADRLAGRLGATVAEWAAQADVLATMGRRTDEAPELTTGTGTEPTETEPPVEQNATASFAGDTLEAVMLQPQPAREMSAEEIEDQLVLLDAVEQKLQDTDHPQHLALLHRARERTWELEREADRRHPPATGTGEGESRGDLIRDRLGGAGLDVARARPATPGDIPPAKPGAPNEGEWQRIDTAAKAREAYPPTEEQQLIIEAAARRRLNVAVSALAGTGKSSTLKMLAQRMPGQRIVYMAFNKDIVGEAQAAKARGEYPPNVEVMTANGAAYRAVGKPYRHRMPSDRKGGAKRQKVEEVADLMRIYDGMTYAQHATISRLRVAMLARETINTWVKSADPEPTQAHVPWDNVLPEHRAEVFGKLRPIVDRMWEDINDPDGRLTYDHDYVVKRWALAGYAVPGDVLLFDEAQDVNPVLDGVVRGAMDAGVQVVAVGDSHQAIYGFRGAADSLATLPVDARLTLTKSFRFGPEVADAGNRVLRMLGADLRLRGHEAKDSRIEELAPGEADAVVCRTNTGVISEAISALEQGKRVAVAGGVQEIRSFVRAARSLQSGHVTEHRDLAAFADWDQVRAYVETESDAAGSMATFVRLIDDDQDGRLEQLIADRGLAETIQLSDDGRRLWIAGTKPPGQNADHDSFRDWLKWKDRNGFGRVEWDRDSSRWWYEPGEHSSTYKGRTRQWTNNATVEEARAAIIRHIEQHTEVAADGPGLVVGQDQQPDIVISTVHRAKGLEWPRVRMGSDFKQVQYDSVSGLPVLATIPDDELLRGAYVALTRATSVLDTGSLGWIYNVTKSTPDPMQRPERRFQRDFNRADLTLGDTIRYHDEGASDIYTGRITRLDDHEVHVANEAQPLSYARILTRNGAGRPELSIASEEDLDRALTAGAYTALLTGPQQPDTHPRTAETEPAGAQAAQTTQETERVPLPMTRIRLVHNGPGVVVSLPSEDADLSTLLPGGASALSSLPGLRLPAHADLPSLVRPTDLSHTLVSGKEIEQWLGEHLRGSELEPAWTDPAVRAQLSEAVGDLVRDSMAPAAEDVVEWLVAAAGEDENLLRLAHGADEHEFLDAFAAVADDLMRGGASEHAAWTYLGRAGVRRPSILKSAAPRAYQELRESDRTTGPAEAAARGAQGPETPQHSPGIATEAIQDTPFGDITDNALEEPAPTSKPTTEDEPALITDSEIALGVAAVKPAAPAEPLHDQEVVEPGLGVTVEPDSGIAAQEPESEVTAEPAQQDGQVVELAAESAGQDLRVGTPDGPGTVTYHYDDAVMVRTAAGVRVWPADDLEWPDGMTLRKAGEDLHTERREAMRRSRAGNDRVVDDSVIGEAVAEGLFPDRIPMLLEAMNDSPGGPQGVFAEWVAEAASRPFTRNLATNVPVRQRVNAEGIVIDAPGERHVVPWEEVPAWVETALGSELGEQVSAAVDLSTKEIRMNQRSLVHQVLADAISAGGPPAPAALRRSREQYGSSAPQPQPVPGSPGYTYTKAGESLVIRTDDGAYVDEASGREVMWPDAHRMRLPEPVDEAAAWLTRYHRSMKGDLQFQPAPDTAPVRLVHSQQETSVHGISPEDTLARMTLESLGFEDLGGSHWRSTRDFFYRESEARYFVNRLADAGRAVDVQEVPVSEREPEAGQEITPSQLVRGDRVRVTGNSPQGQTVTRSGYLLQQPRRVRADRRGERVTVYRLWVDPDPDAEAERSNLISVLEGETVTRLERAGERVAEAKVAAADPVTEVVPEQAPPPPPASDAEIRFAVMYRVGGIGTLPDLIRALEQPEMMRRFVRNESRKERKSGDWHIRLTEHPMSAEVSEHLTRVDRSPEGLVLVRGVDNNHTHLVPWTDVPAWVEMGLDEQVQEQILTAARRWRTAVAGLDRDAQDEAMQQYRAATHVLLEAMEEVERPSDEALDRARLLFSSALAEEVQDSLFDGLGEEPQPAPLPEPQQKGASESSAAEVTAENTTVDPQPSSKRSDPLEEPTPEPAGTSVPRSEPPRANDPERLQTDVAAQTDRPAQGAGRGQFPATPSEEEPVSELAGPVSVGDPPITDLDEFYEELADAESAAQVSELPQPSPQEDSPQVTGSGGNLETITDFEPVPPPQQPTRIEEVPTQPEVSAVPTPPHRERNRQVPDIRDTPETEDITMATPAATAAETGGGGPVPPVSAPPLLAERPPNDTVSVGTTEYARFTRPEDGVTRIAGLRDGAIFEVLPWAPAPMAQLAWGVLRNDHSPEVEQRRLVEAAMRDLNRVYGKLARQTQASSGWSSSSVTESAHRDGLQARLQDPSRMMIDRLAEVEQEIQSAELARGVGRLLPDQYNARMRELLPVRDGLLLVREAAEVSRAVPDSVQEAGLTTPQVPRTAPSAPEREQAEVVAEPISMQVGQTTYGRSTDADGTVRIVAVHADQPNNPDLVYDQAPQILADLAWSTLTQPGGAPSPAEQRSVERALRDLLGSYRRGAEQIADLRQRGESAVLTTEESAALRATESLMADPGMLVSARLSQLRAAFARADADLASGTIIQEQHSNRLEQLELYRPGLEVISKLMGLTPREGAESVGEDGAPSRLGARVPDADAPRPEDSVAMGDAAEEAGLQHGDSHAPTSAFTADEALAPEAGATTQSPEPDMSAIEAALPEARAAFTEVVETGADAEAGWADLNRGIEETKVDLADLMRSSLTVEEATQQQASELTADVNTELENAPAAPTPPSETAVRQGAPASRETFGSPQSPMPDGEEPVVGWDQFRSLVDRAGERLPERIWKPIQRVISRLDQTWRRGMEAAGQRWEQLRADVRWQGLWRTVVSTTAKAVSDFARRAAEIGSSLPGGEARAQLLEGLATGADRVAERQSRTHFPGGSYQNAGESARAARDLARVLREWTETEMGADLTTTTHPAVAALRDAWEALPPNRRADPEIAVEPYREVARTATSLLQKLEASSKTYDPEQVQMLQDVAKGAHRHAQRLAASLPPGHQAASPQPRPQAVAPTAVQASAAPAAPAAPAVKTTV
ncbi:UvrD-helicase domain-containing protein [Streptomyces sp. G-5]|uniref:UvrD-helicase domain-containing protein n=1 Tax=Streptomyces sp. G-5 TaxID=2977231 RepID=UPI0021CFBDA3|nr:UvrD-helicase domain-containing protein [Streptomyces sp. G-5]MCU4750307.1 AAA family ATPase [Streptomyces sp. G-5]